MTSGKNSEAVGKTKVVALYSVGFPLLSVPQHFRPILFEICKGTTCECTHLRISDLLT
jgi:hypothetical protein